MLYHDATGIQSVVSVCRSRQQAASSWPQTHRRTGTELGCVLSQQAHPPAVPSCSGHQVCGECVQAKAASDARLARDVQEAEDRAEASAAEEARLRQQELESIDRSACDTPSEHGAGLDIVLLLCLFIDMSGWDKESEHGTSASLLNIPLIARSVCDNKVEIWHECVHGTSKAWVCSTCPLANGDACMAPGHCRQLNRLPV